MRNLIGHNPMSGEGDVGFGELGTVLVVSDATTSGNGSKNGNGAGSFRGAPRHSLSEGGVSTASEAALHAAAAAAAAAASPGPGVAMRSPSAASVYSEVAAGSSSSSGGGGSSSGGDTADRWIWEVHVNTSSWFELKAWQCQLLESARARGVDEVELDKNRIVSLPSMVQTRTDTGKTRKLRRRDRNSPTGSKLVVRWAGGLVQEWAHYRLQLASEPVPDIVEGYE